MLAFVARRLLAAVPVILVVGATVFVLIHLAPGDPIRVMLGPDARLEQVERFRQELGLNQPLPVQFALWFSRAMVGDLGESIFLRRPVTEAILTRLEPTLLLTFGAVIIAIVIGVTAGLISGLRRGTWIDQFFMFLALLGVSIPEFWLALNLVILFGVEWRLFPVAGYVTIAEGGLWAAIRHLTLASLAVGFIQSALIARMTRSSIIEVMSLDYIRTAKAKGLARLPLVLKHALRNAMIPIITVIGLVFALSLGGAIVVEIVFNIPGVGRLLIQAVGRRDYPVIQGVALYIAFAYVLANLLVDMTYGLIDPRIRYD
ncbi:MAG: ABC transporter permease [Trueperaceae bacterium]